MKKWMALSLALVVLFSACAHKNCCGHCKHDTAATEVAAKA